MTSFVAGATGYTGQEIVKILAERGDRVVAHIRPESSKRESYTQMFEEVGAEVDVTPWEKDAMREAIAELKPDVVYCTIGTTRARKKVADDKELETYHAVDYGLTVLLAGACVDAGISPRFVYLSAVGVGPDSLSEYMRARYEAENFIQHAEIPYTFIRPSFISGTDREEFRMGERVGAVVGDAGLKMAGLLGFVGLRDKYSSMTAKELATAMVAAADDSQFENEALDPRQLRRLL